MDKEIKRNDWSRFCKRFTADNQYRPTRMSVKRRGNDTTAMEIYPFMGIALSKKGRSIDGVQFYTGCWNPESVVEPIVTVTNPANMRLEKDTLGHDTALRIRSKDGVEVCLELTGDKNVEMTRHLVEKVAYAMYECRGYGPGNDWKDWFEAEHRVHEAEMHLVR